MDKRTEIEEKLKSKDIQRQMVKKGKQEGQAEEKDPNEDYNVIDLKFTSTIAKINSQVTLWKSHGDDKAGIEKHFEDLFNQYKELREYIANYSYSIPSYNL